MLVVSNILKVLFMIGFFALAVARAELAPLVLLILG